MHSIGHLHCHVKQQCNRHSRVVAGEPEFTEFVQQATLTALERVFNTFDALPHWQNMNIQLDKIDIDLPEARYPEDTERYQNTIYRQLFTEIKKQLPISQQHQFQLSQLFALLAELIQTKNTEQFIRHSDQLFKRFAEGSAKDKVDIRNWWLAQLIAKDTRKFIAPIDQKNFIHRLFLLLSPEQGRFILSVIDNHDVFVLAAEEQPKQQKQSKLKAIEETDQIKTDPVTQVQLIEFSLAFFSVERGSQFNRKIYLRSVLNSLAAHYNTSVTQLYQRLALAAEQLPVNHKLRNDLLDITAVDAKSSAGGHSARLAAVETTMAQLKSGIKITAEQWLALFNRFGKDDPGLLDTFLLQLLTEKKALNAFVKSLPKSLQQKVLERYQILLPGASVKTGKWLFRVQLRQLADYAESTVNDLSVTAFISHTDIDQVREWLQHQPRLLREGLLQSTDSGRLLRALAISLKPSELRALIQILDVNAANVLDRFAPLLRFRFAQLGVLNPLTIEQVLWHSALSGAYLCATKPQQHFSLSHWLTDFIAELKITSGQILSTSECSWLQDLVSGTAKETDTAEYEELQYAVKQLLADSARQDTTLDKATMLWLQAVEQALWLNKPVAADLPAIKEIPESVSQPVKSSLLLLLAAARIRERFIALPEQVQMPLLRLIVPASNTELLLLWHCSPVSDSRFAFKTDNVQPDVNKPAVHHQIKLFLLAYLANDRGSQFNQRSFGRSLVRQLSAHFNISYYQFIDQMQALYGDNPMAQRPLSWLWDNHKSEQELLADKAQAEPDLNEQTIASVYFAYQNLLAGLATPSVAATLDWQHSFRLLKTYSPEFLLSWFRTLQHKPDRLFALMTQANAEPVLWNILTVVLTLTGHINPTDGHGLLISMKKFADKSPDVCRYYALVIYTLITGKLLNLEAIRQQCIEESTTKAVSVDVNNKDSDPVNASIGKRSNSTDVSVNRSAFTDDQQTLKTLWLRFPELWSMVQIVENVLRVAQSNISALELKQLFLNYLTQFESKEAAKLTIEFLIQKLLAIVFAQLTFADYRSFKARLLQQLNEDMALCIRTGASSQFEKRCTVLQQLLNSFALLDFKTDAQFSRLMKQWQANEPLSLTTFTPQQAEEKIQSFVAEQQTDTPLVKSEQWQRVNHAGLVLLSPYLPMLMQRLSLLDKTTFADEAAQQKAISAMLYLCSREADTFASCQASVVNILVNRLPQAPLKIQALSQQEKDLCDGMLHAVISHWTAIGKTSLAGLRETFLQREGQLRFEPEKGWLLVIEKRPFDVLLKRLPWGLSTVKHKFMDECIYVEW